MNPLPLPQPYTLLILNSATDLPILNEISQGSLQYIWNNALHVIAADGAVNLLAQSSPKFGLLTPHYCIGDLDSCTVENELESLGTVVIRNSSQMENDCSKALQLIQKLNLNTPVSLVVVGILGGRLDQVVANINNINQSTFFSSIIGLSVDNYIQVLREGSHVLSRIPGFLGNVGLLPLSGTCSVKTTGLKWNVDGELSMDSLVSSSNGFECDVAEVVVVSGTLWVSFEWKF
ncbi:hypothetical protein GEMRC1_000045 [Eukaryota sp. GEM-RC1]